MKLSIVLSTYNGEKYILEQLDSFRAQTRQPNEVLIFDDGSSDRTVPIIKEYIREHQLIGWKLTQNESNKGWKRNFIEGFYEASGDLIFPSDQDDIWLSEKLEECEKIMSENPKIDLLASNYVAFYDNGHTAVEPTNEDGKVKKYELDCKLLNTKYPGCTYCFRNSMISLVQKYWNQDFAHDAVLWRLAAFSDSFYTYGKSLIRWRRHNDSSYTVESHQARSIAGKKASFAVARNYIIMWETYMRDEGVENGEKWLLLKRAGEWLDIRERFYNTKNPLVGIWLFKYCKFYARFRQYVGDWYMVYLKDWN